jgi:hypothetical protein
LTTSAAAVAAVAAVVVLGVQTVRTGQERDTAEAQLVQLQVQYSVVAQNGALLLVSIGADQRRSAGQGDNGKRFMQGLGMEFPPCTLVFGGPATNCRASFKPNPLDAPVTGATGR